MQESSRVRAEALSAVQKELRRCKTFFMDKEAAAET
jgi:hypothetical protein